MTIREHALEPTANQPAAQPEANDSQRRSVFDLVTQDRPPYAVVEKPVAVIPVGERAAFLPVCEQMRRIVLGMDSHPAQAQWTHAALQNDPAADLQ